MPFNLLDIGHLVYVFVTFNCRNILLDILSREILHYLPIFYILCILRILRILRRGG